MQRICIVFYQGMGYIHIQVKGYIICHSGKNTSYHTKISYINKNEIKACTFPGISKLF